MSKKPARSSSNGNLTGNHHANTDTFLPPICVTNKLDSGDNASDEHETDDSVNMVTPSTVVPSPPRRFRKTKHHKQPHNRHLVNKSSMSDSFVLPIIGFGGSPPNTGNSGQREAGWRENRAATHPDRKNERRYRGIPLSKSCPILGERRSTQRFNSTDYDDDEFESDDEDSDADSDFKSMSYNLGVASKLSKHHRVTFDNSEYPDDEITNGVLCKLAKLESPRIKDIKSSANASSVDGTKLPDIFGAKPMDNDADRELPRLAKKSLLAKYENANKQLPLDSRTKTKPGAKRHPELSPTCNSRTLETRMSSSWKLGGSSSSSTASDTSGGSSSSSTNTNNTLVPSPHLLRSSQDDPDDTVPSNSTPPLRGSNKTRRKIKKRNEKSSEESNTVEHAIKDNGEHDKEAETPDTKCRQWLNENNQKSPSENTSKETEEVL